MKRFLRAPRPVIGFVIAGIALLAPASAHATAHIHRTGNTITLTSDAASDRIVADNRAASSTRVRYRNTAGRLVAGHGCSVVPLTTWVDCGAIARDSVNRLTLNADLGDGNDTLLAHSDNDRMPRVLAEGGAGNDLIVGSTNSDDLKGGDGDDTLRGLDDTDNLDGEAGNDTEFGGIGNDVLTGGAGMDHLYGDEATTSAVNWGADEIVSVDLETDMLHCGAGNDAAVVDNIDTLADSSCESLAGGQTTPPLANPAGTLPLAITIGAPPVVPLRKLVNGVPLHYAITFSAPVTIKALLKISAAEAIRTGLGTHGMTLSSDLGTPMTLIPMTLNAQMRMNWLVRPAVAAMIARGTVHSVHATIAITGTDVNLHSTTVTRTVTLVR